MAVGIRRMNFLMVVGMKWTGDRPMAACTRYSGDNLDIGVIHPSQWKTTKRQWMRIRSMVAGTRQADSGLRVETNPYLKRARQVCNNLITINTQRTDSGLMVVSQRTTMLRVVVVQ